MALSESEIINHFVREPDGSWRCASFAEFTTSRGRVQISEGARFTPGTIFMGVDVVKLLDDLEERRL